MDQVGPRSRCCCWGRFPSHSPLLHLNNFLLQAGRTRRQIEGHQCMGSLCHHTSSLARFRTTGRCNACKQLSILVQLSCTHKCWYNPFYSCRKSSSTGVEGLVLSSWAVEWGHKSCASSPNRGDSSPLPTTSAPETNQITNLWDQKNKVMKQNNSDDVVWTVSVEISNVVCSRMKINNWKKKPRILPGYESAESGIVQHPELEAIWLGWN